jgi:hypothetical protein
MRLPDALEPSDSKAATGVGFVVISAGFASSGFAGSGVIGAVTGGVMGAFIAILGDGLVTFVGTLIVVPFVGAGALIAFLSRLRRHSAAASDAAVDGLGWRTMRVAARLMPPAAGSRWLAEARSFLVEAPPEMRRAAVASYLASASMVIVQAWAQWMGLVRRNPGDR